MTTTRRRRSRPAPRSSTPSTGKNLGNLEQFHVTDGASTVTSANRNYWGVTFAADSDHFFATLGRGARIQLIAGSVSSRSAHTIRNGLECPSLSPDQTRIAYKSRRVGGTLTAVKWRLHVVDLRTGADIALAETRSVDDQVEWLDNNTILYSILRSQSRHRDQGHLRGSRRRQRAADDLRQGCVVTGRRQLIRASKAQPRVRPKATPLRRPTGSGPSARLASTTDRASGEPS